MPDNIAARLGFDPEAPRDDRLYAMRELPQNFMAEQAVLGAIMGNAKALDKVAEFLEPKHFAQPHHGRIYEEQRKRIQAGGVADAVAMKLWWEADPESQLVEPRGAAYLLRLISPSMLGVDQYALEIVKAWQGRSLIAASRCLTDMAYDPSVNYAQAAHEAMAEMETILADRRAASWVSLDSAMDSALGGYERAMKGEASGISTGFKSLDYRLGGMEPGMVYVIGGRTGMGKSALGHGIALNVARAGIGVLELSLEMSTEQVARRTLSLVSGVPIIAIKRGSWQNGEADRLVKARHELKNLPLSIDDAGGQTAEQVAEKARLYKRRHGLGLLLIDHLNLVRPAREDARHGATWTIERASHTVKEVAKYCEVPVLLLCQLNRGVEGREDKRPNLADLRQAGAIEEDADAVGLVYREEYYLRDEPAQYEGETPARFDVRVQIQRERREASAGRADVIWAKTRDGEPGTSRLRFDGPTARFWEETV